MIDNQPVVPELKYRRNFASYTSSLRRGVLHQNKQTIPPLYSLFSFTPIHQYHQDPRHTQISFTDMPEPLDVDVTDNGLQDPRPRGTWSDWLQAFFSGITASVMVAVFAYTYVLWKENPWSQEYFDNMLEEIVTAPYNPITPEKYVTRQQHGNLSANLRTFANSGGENGFFMLVGESGSGKTTLMRTLLRNEYKEGVLELTLSATEMVIGRAKGVPFLKQIQASVYSLFGECPERSKRFPGFINFVNHANEVRKKAKKDAHQLIIYITLESKDELDFDTMKEFGKAFGSVATLLSSKTGSCKTIVEFSKPAISDHIRWYRGSDQSNFEVNAMTEDEFQDIGAQLLDVSEDKQTISVPYLEHYHNWLGGHTKTLKKLSGDAKIASMRTILLPFCNAY